MNSTSHLHATPSTTLTGPLLWLRNLLIVICGSALLAICAHIALPLAFTPVPLTLEPFAVLLLGLLLPPALAFSTTTAYLLEGAAGLPVFAPGALGVSGVAHLLGPTGGYLMAYPLAVFLISRLWRSHERTLVWALLSALAGDVAILGLGALWLSGLTHASVDAIVTQSILPFLPGDALKVIVAASLAFEWQRLRKPSRVPDSTN